MNKSTISLFLLCVLGILFLVWRTVELESRLEAVLPSNKQEPVSQQLSQPLLKDQPKSENSQPDPRLGNIEALLTKLVEEMDLLKQSVEKNTENINLSALQQPLEDDQPPSIPLTEEDRMQRYQDQVDAMEYLLNDPARTDSIWSTATETKIEQLILGTPELSVASSVHQQCGDTLCKISAVLPGDLTAYEKDAFGWTLLTKMGKELPTATSSVINNPDGSQEVIYYMGRAGYPLPGQEIRQ